MAPKSRKRGVKASRVKLNVAMLNAGIKTQASLAEKIATKENLETAPKDTVNKAFREESVSPATIARIANILAVEADSLYLKPTEIIENSFQQSTRVKNTPNRLKFNIQFFFALVTPVLIIFLFYQLNKTESTPTEFIVPHHTTMPILGNLSVAIYPYSSAVDELTVALINEMTEKFNIVKINRALISPKFMSVDIAQEYEADAVITIRHLNVGRFTGLQIYLYLNGVEKLIWTDNLLNISLEKNAKSIALSLLPPINLALTNTQSPAHEKLIFLDLDSQKKYLKGRDSLDESESEIEIKRAQSLFQSILLKYPTDSKTLSALCEAFVEDSWRGNEKELLEKAQIQCSKALTFAPESQYSRSTLAYLYRRSGRLDKSIDLYLDVLKSSPSNIHALSGIASAYLEAFRQNSKKHTDAINKMMFYAKKAIQTEPLFWKHHSALGVFAYHTGNMEIAASAFATTAELNPNELAYTNVGTINRCLGNLDKAEDFYLKAMEIAPSSYLGKEYLGTIYFYKNKFAESAILKRQALDTFADTDDGGIHQMWGELGHSYRKSKNIEKAIGAYLTALKIIERDSLRGNIATADNIFRYQYKLILSVLNPLKYSRKELLKAEPLLSGLAKNKTDATASAALAHSYIILGENRLALKALKSATEACPVFSKHPDLISL